MTNVEKLNVEEIQNNHNKTKEILSGSLERSFGLRMLAENYCVTSNVIECRENDLKRLGDYADEVPHLKSWIKKLDTELKGIKNLSLSMNSSTYMDGMYLLVFIGASILDLHKETHSAYTKEKLCLIYEAIRDIYYTLSDTDECDKDDLLYFLMNRAMPEIKEVY